MAATGAVAAAILPLASLAPTAQAAAGARAAGDKVAQPAAKPIEKSKTGSYIVLMEADPLARSVKQQDLNKAPANTKRKALKATHDRALKGARISTKARTTDFSNTLNGFAVRTDLKGAERLAKQAGVAAVMPDEMRQPQAIAADVARGKANPRALNALNDYLGLSGKRKAYASGLKGDGVLVGVIDTGIWPEQPMLADDGTFPAKPTFDETERSSCDFGNTAHKADDAPFTCNNKLVGARQFLDTYKANTGLTADEFDSARDESGHGTHTATTAAGNANVQSEIFGVKKDVVSGIAPRAQVIAYKALGDQGGYTSDLSAAIDQAVADGVDVINYSIGGGARVVSADTIAFLIAANVGVFSAVSAGNSGPGPKTVGGPSNVPWVTSVGATTFPRNYAGSIRLANGKVFKGTSVTKGTGVVPVIDGARAGLAGKANPGFCVEGSLDPAKVKGKIVLCERGFNGRVAKSSEVLRAGGAGMVLFNAVDVDTMFSDTFFVPTVMMDKTPGEEIRAWVNSQASPTAQLKNDGINTLGHYSPTVTYFSSRGETVPNGDIIKPDISAPGAQIMAGNTPSPVPGSQPAGQLWQAIAGTSMSSPVVAGMYALLKQANPDWSAAAAKSALMTSASQVARSNDRVSPATPFDTGSGFADLGRPANRGTAFQPGLVYDARFDDYRGFLCAEAPEAYSDPDTMCADLEAAGYPTTAANLNYASIGMEAVPGVQTVKRKVTNVSDSTIRVTANVQAPSGYSVSVSPSTLAVPPRGGTASFEVTVRNTGAAVGEWKFGSLTWIGSGYEVRSPIAVKGAAIAAPASVTGTGTSGTATVPVTVGQPGQYTATAHGLVGTTHNNVTIAQDPDQTYPSPDDGAGVVQVPFSLSGVDHARWKLQVPGDVDLDLYLRGPHGQIIAASTNGATDEQIDLDRPANGNYTMVVHGWAVGSTPMDVDLQSWLVPTTTGGSLSVTSGSPTTATPGTKVDVGLGWSGLAAGDTYLGTVSHAIGGTRVASTAVEVTS
ncbi:hypothetical protein N802_03220 [Knoellia sinensis KCTC 19936]|uniref:Serine protease n=1 Tax=Knoellia sinensis KCTC 19936 TaxID=1385520 RepID=A0A0A0J2V6_9MICO|nr:S8 family serine peptidase [Knoellia sinensis]KGN31735.1 hypothetical protein N802_03220 [Knoellia sinensis KCTC 19936]